MNRAPILCVSIVIAVTLFGCQQISPRPDGGLKASSFTYALPETSVKISVDLVLENCTTHPVARAQTSITPVANTTDKNQYTIDGNTLKSFFEKREIKLELHKNGALKSVNASSTDATAGIIGGLIKFATVFLAPADTISAGPCNQQTLKAITLRNSLRVRLKDLQHSQSNSQDPSKVEKDINAIIQQIARLESGPLLTKLSRSIPIRSLQIQDEETKQFRDLPNEDGSIIRWKYGDFWKWYDVDDDDKKTATDAFSLNYCVTAATTNASNCLSSIIAGYNKASAKSPKVKLTCDPCDKQLVFREPLQGIVILSAARDGDFFSPKIKNGGGTRGDTIKQDGILGKQSVLIAQWGTTDFIDLNVGFGESQTISASFDAFGKKNMFGWTSNARGEAIVGGLNTIAEAAQKAASADDGEDLADAKATIDKLETIQKLNKLEKCRSILDNGGFVCPEE